MSLFIGREQTFKELENYFQEVIKGHGKVVLISGEPGIGKTTFIEQFKRGYIDKIEGKEEKEGKTHKKGKQPEIRFVDIQCSDLVGEGQPYAPFFNLIEKLVIQDKASGSKKLAKIITKYGQLDFGHL